MVQREGVDRDYDRDYNSDLSEDQSLPDRTTDLKPKNSELLYGLYDRPPLAESIFVAIQHVLAAFVGIVTPSLLISSALGLDAATTSYLVSMSLFATGLCTFIPTRCAMSAGAKAKSKV
ncbi:MAG: solute carrier family 23 protein [Elainella sp.]